MYFFLSTFGGGDEPLRVLELPVQSQGGKSAVERLRPEGLERP